MNNFRFSFTSNWMGQILGGEKIINSDEEKKYSYIKGKNFANNLKHL